MSDVGFIGLGTMGAEIARRLVEADLDVIVWNRSETAMEPLLAAGARAAGTPAEALRAGVTFSMLANDDAVDAVFSDETLAAVPGAAHVNMATVSTDTARRLQSRHADHSVSYAAAPVLGRPHLAAAGQLNVVVAGDQNAIDRAEKFFPVMSKKVWHVGADAAQANLVKIAVNYNLIHTMQALAESVGLVERGGVDPHLFVDVLTDAAYTGSAYTGYGSIIARRNYTPAAFSVALGLKDLTLVQAAADQTGTALPTMGVFRSIFEEALADPDLAIQDWSAMAEITRRRAG